MEVGDKAKELLKEVEEKKAKREAEARDAAQGKSNPKDGKKPEKTKEAEENIEAKAKEDEKILSTEDGKLDEKGKERKGELLKKKKSSDEEAKKKATQEKINKRIGELHGKIKDLEKNGEAKDGEIQILKDEVTKLKPAPEVTDAEFLKKINKERLGKYIEEDKAKPREERREMSREELEEWMGEDLVSSQEWISERLFRRKREESQDRENLNTKKFLKDLIPKQNKSWAKVKEKHPELDTEARMKELEKEGKSKEEIGKLIMEERPKVKAYADIIKQHPDWFLDEDGPEKVIAEMEKKEPAKEEDNEKVEALTKEIDDLKAELERREIADDAAGDGSSYEGKEKKTQTDVDKKQESIANKLGISSDRLKKRLKEREKQGILSG